MYCPICGKELILEPKQEPPEITWDEPDDELNKLLKEWEYFNKEGPENYKCSNTDCAFCTGGLLYHHPIHGTDKPAGDSWSISYIK
jgi:hypothetical protein